MNFEDLIHKRYSCRHYSPEAIQEDLLQKVLEAARLAPTAANRQPFQIIIIKTENQQEELMQIYNRDWFVQPPLILAVCSQPRLGWIRKKFDQQSYAVVDAAIVVDHITLQAADLGLGTCWIGAFNPQAAREFLKIPDDVEPIAFTPLGYPLDAPGEKTRKPLEDLIRYDTW
ncbi:MAG: nitroreductase family protein [Chloroflexi bacterium]|nr:nitroreductase family protein [Chloroflexota bacterium]